MKHNLTRLFNMVLVLSLGLGLFGQPVRKVEAQTSINAQSWQTGAQGLKATSLSYTKTAGLGFTVDASTWPGLRMHGGVRSEWDLLLGPSGIELGRIKTPQSSTAALSAQTASWAKNKLTFTPGSGAAVDLWVSRLTPAVLASTTGSVIRLFTGSVPFRKIVNGVYSEGTQLVRPKYIAYSSGSVLRYATLGSGATNLMALDQGWMLVWFGANSHFIDTKRILDYGAPLISDGYLADVPMLLVFQNAPTSIFLSSEGGVEVTFNGQAGKVEILPLYGRLHLAASQTETWANNLPAAVQQKIQFWAPRMAYFPADVAETYSYTAVNDTAVITETITYEAVRASGIQFAPLPPMLALAEPLLRPSFSHTLVDGDLPTQFGPVKGFDNRASYTWSVSGLSDYVDLTRKVPQDVSGVPADVLTELTSQVDRLVAAGHMDPWLYGDQIPNLSYRGDLYWANPADTLYHLAEVADALPQGATRTNLLTYMANERNAYPPEDVYNLNFGLGAKRGPTGLPAVGENMADELFQWNWNRKEVFLTRVPLYSYYGLSRYYQTVGGSPSATTYQKAVQAVDRDMKEQDWATSGYFLGYQERRVAVVSTNRHFAGMVGFVRMAEMAGDTANSQLGRALLAKAAVARLGQARYPRYLMEAGIIALPGSPKWQVTSLVDSWLGVIFNYSWTTAYDDPRQPLYISQFDIELFDHSGPFADGVEWDHGTTAPYLISYRDMVPELARLFANYAPNDARVTLDKVQAITPHWYATFGEATLGMEHNTNHPVDSFQLFLAETYFDSPSADQLARFADIPWLERGDLFYLQKLAETVLAYRGAVWENEAKLFASSGDQEILLNWTFKGVVDVPYTWRVDYRLLGAGSYQSIGGLPQAARSYRLQGLQNYQKYDIRVVAEGGGQELVITNVVFMFPTDIHVMLPVIRR